MRGQKPRIATSAVCLEPSPLMLLSKSQHANPEIDTQPTMIHSGLMASLVLTLTLWEPPVIFSCLGLTHHTSVRRRRLFPLFFRLAEDDRWCKKKILLFRARPPFSSAGYPSTPPPTRNHCVGRVGPGAKPLPLTNPWGSLVISQTPCSHFYTLSSFDSLSYNDPLLQLDQWVA